jgi:hypothetical protein
MTHAYFCFYHALANVVLRRVEHAAQRHGRIAQIGAVAVAVFLLAYATAFMETLTIAHFPYYRFKVCLPCYLFHSSRWLHVHAKPHAYAQSPRLLLDE